MQISSKNSLESECLGCSSKKAQNSGGKCLNAACCLLVSCFSCTVCKVGVKIGQQNIFITEVSMVGHSVTLKAANLCLVFHLRKVLKIPILAFYQLTKYLIKKLVGTSIWALHALRFTSFSGASICTSLQVC